MEEVEAEAGSLRVDEGKAAWSRPNPCAVDGIWKSADATVAQCRCSLVDEDCDLADGESFSACLICLLPIICASITSWKRLALTMAEDGLLLMAFCELAESGEGAEEWAGCSSRWGCEAKFCSEFKFLNKTSYALSRKCVREIFDQMPLASGHLRTGI